MKAHTIIKGVIYPDANLWRKLSCRLVFKWETNNKSILSSLVLGGLILEMDKVRFYSSDGLSGQQTTKNQASTQTVTPSKHLEVEQYGLLRLIILLARS